MTTMNWELWFPSFSLHFIIVHASGVIVIKWKCVLISSLAKCSIVSFEIVLWLCPVLFSSSSSSFISTNVKLLLITKSIVDIHRNISFPIHFPPHIIYGFNKSMLVSYIQKTCTFTICTRSLFIPENLHLHLPIHAIFLYFTNFLLLLLNI